MSSKGSISGPTADWAGDGNFELYSSELIYYFCSFCTEEAKYELLMNSF